MERNCSGKLEFCLSTLWKCVQLWSALSVLCVFVPPPPWHWTLPIVQEVENGRIRRRMSDINRAGAFHLLAAIKHFLCCWWITEWVDRWMDEHWCFLCSFLLFHSKFTQFCLFYSFSPDLESYSLSFPLGLPLCAGYLSLLLRLWTCVSVSLWVFVITAVSLGNFPLPMIRMCKLVFGLAAEHIKNLQCYCTVMIWLCKLACIFPGLPPVAPVHPLLPPKKDKWCTVSLNQLITAFDTIFVE